MDFRLWRRSAKSSKLRPLPAKRRSIAEQLERLRQFLEQESVPV